MKKYVAGAVVAWLALTWIIGKRLYPTLLQSSMSPIVRDIAMTATAIGLFILCMAVAAVIEHWQAKPKAPPPQSLSGLDEQVNARFPPDIIYRVPKHPDLAKMWGYNEDSPKVWTDILKRYPTAPQTEAEREEREARLWALYAENLAVKDTDGKANLKPKQAILDYFKEHEKWIFRYYYAATGVVNKTILEEISSACVASRQAIDAHRRVRSASNGQEMNRTGDAFARVIQQTLPAHLEKWGGWFFFHVQEAFNAAHKTETNFGPQSATTPTTHAANDDLSYKPNA